MRDHDESFPSVHGQVVFTGTAPVRTAAVRRKVGGNPVVPENAIQAKTSALSGELAGTCTADSGERTADMGCFGAKVTRFEVVPRTPTTNRRHKRTA
jgi:hypothetical protein